MEILNKSNYENRFITLSMCKCTIKINKYNYASQICIEQELDKHDGSNHLALESSFNFQLNLHLEKSISGCDSMNFLSMSCFFCSSDVGKPISFCLWSNIIFSTIERVSPSWEQFNKNYFISKKLKVSLKMFCRYLKCLFLYH